VYFVLIGLDWRTLRTTGVSRQVINYVDIDDEGK
jgi:hypothetical protein